MLSGQGEGEQPNDSVGWLLCEDNDNDDGLFSPFHHLEIVGLYSSNNGCSCSFRECCGEQVQVGDLLCIKRTLVDTTDGMTDEALCCVVIKDGNKLCRVAFIPHFLCALDIVLKNINKFLHVDNLFKDSDNTAKQQKSRQLGRVADVIFIDKIPIKE